MLKIEDEWEEIGLFFSYGKLATGLTESRHANSALPVVAIFINRL